MATKERQPYGAGAVELSVAPVRDGLVPISLSKEGTSHRQALRLLRERGVAAASIVRVDPFGIAWRDRYGGVRTTFTRVEALPDVDLMTEPNLDGKFRLHITSVGGLPAFPPE